MSHLHGSRGLAASYTQPGTAVLPYTGPSHCSLNWALVGSLAVGIYLTYPSLVSSLQWPQSSPHPKCEPTACSPDSPPVYCCLTTPSPHVGSPSSPRCSLGALSLVWMRLLAGILCSLAQVFPAHQLLTFLMKRVKIKCYYFLTVFIFVCLIPVY